MQNRLVALFMQEPKKTSQIGLQKLSFEQKFLSWNGTIEKSEFSFEFSIVVVW